MEIGKTVGVFIGGSLHGQTWAADDVGPTFLNPVNRDGKLAKERYRRGVKWVTALGHGMTPISTYELEGVEVAEA